jgi:hypothetical protein
MEKLDILVPPDFKKSSQIKNVKQAIEDGDWLGTFNLWVIQNKPVPAIIYQQRSPNASWAPLKLDVTAGGHYTAGESIKDGLREVREELGRKYNFKELTPLGRRLNVGVDTKKRQRRTVCDIFIVLDDAPLSSYTLQKEEVHAIFSCPIDTLLKVHTKKGYTFTAVGLTNTGKATTLKVSKSSFPYNWDDYHFKMALLAKRFLKNEQSLLY